MSRRLRPQEKLKKIQKCFENSKIYDMNPESLDGLCFHGVSFFLLENVYLNISVQTAIDAKEFQVFENAS